MRSTRRTSDATKKAQGTFRAARTRPQSPQYAPGATRPKYLSKLAKAEWNRIAPILEEQGILQEIDQGLLASYCTYYANWQICEAEIAKQGMVLMVESSTRTGRTVKPTSNPAIRNSLSFHRAMLAAGTKLGISPLDRPRIEVKPNDESDLLQDFIDGVGEFAD